MNKIRRQKIHNIINNIKEIQKQLDLIREEEEDCYDNLSEGLQSTTRGEEMSDAIDIMEACIDTIDDIIDDLSTL